MMSRVTPPVTRLTQGLRRISSTSNASRSSVLLDSQARNAYLPRPKNDLKAECIKRQLKTSGSKAELVERLATYDLINKHEFHSSHRPTPIQTRTIPMMQGFRTSAPKQAAGDTSTIDFFYFPDMPDPPPRNPFAKLRVPLLPDNYAPDRSPSSAHAVEALDEAVPRPEISIMAAHPENVVPASISEVVGNDGVEVDIQELVVESARDVSNKVSEEAGMLKELWNGFVDDVFGNKQNPKVAA